MHYMYVGRRHVEYGGAWPARGSKHRDDPVENLGKHSYRRTVATGEELIKKRRGYHPSRLDKFCRGVVSSGRVSGFHTRTDDLGSSGERKAAPPCALKLLWKCALHTFHVVWALRTCGAGKPFSNVRLFTTPHRRFERAAFSLFRCYTVVFNPRWSGMSKVLNRRRTPFIAKEPPTHKFDIQPHPHPSPPPPKKRYTRVPTWYLGTST